MHYSIYATIHAKRRIQIHEFWNRKALPYLVDHHLAMNPLTHLHYKCIYVWNFPRLYHQSTVMRLWCKWVRWLKTLLKIMFHFENYLLKSIHHENMISYAPSYTPVLSLKTRREIRLAAVWRISIKSKIQ